MSEGRAPPRRGPDGARAADPKPVRRVVEIPGAPTIVEPFLPGEPTQPNELPSWSLAGDTGTHEIGTQDVLFGEDIPGLVDFASLESIEAAVTGRAVAGAVGADDAGNLDGAPTLAPPADETTRPIASMPAATVVSRADPEKLPTSPIATPSPSAVPPADTDPGEAVLELIANAADWVPREPSMQPGLFDRLRAGLTSRPVVPRNPSVSDQEVATAELAASDLELLGLSDPDVARLFDEALEGMPEENAAEPVGAVRNQRAPGMRGSMQIPAGATETGSLAELSALASARPVEPTDERPPIVPLPGLVDPNAKIDLDGPTHLAVDAEMLSPKPDLQAARGVVVRAFKMDTEARIEAKKTLENAKVDTRVRERLDISRAQLKALGPLQWPSPGASTEPPVDAPKFEPGDGSTSHLAPPDEQLVGILEKAADQMEARAAALDANSTIDASGDMARPRLPPPSPTITEVKPGPVEIEPALLPPQRPRRLARWIVFGVGLVLSGLLAWALLRG